MHHKKCKHGWFVLKVELENSYEPLEWDFVRKCLHDQNIDAHFISLIMNCINKSTSSVLVNGRKTEVFSHSRGLLQGDLMSPFLVNICLEPLTSKINQACLEKKLDSFLGAKE